MTFKVGDRVECICANITGNTNIVIGITGTVCVDNKNRGSVGVRWDDMVSGHDCGGNCEDGYGWYVLPSDIILYDEDEAADIDESSFISMIGGAR